MNVDDMILISIDDHTIEPPDMFQRTMPAKYRDQAPRLVKDDEGHDRWMFQGNPVGMPGLSATVSWPKEEWGFDPTSLAEMRPGCYDVEARVADMNANGMLAGMNFPTAIGFAGTHVAKLPDQELSAIAISAYNDWAIDELAGEHPGRFIPLAILPYYDIDRAVAEVHRVAKKGCLAVSLPESPYGLGLPSFGSGHFDPLFKALSDTGMVTCLHIALAFGLLKRPEESLADDIMLIAPQLMTVTATDLFLSGLLRRFPDLRFALSEGGIGWVPFFLDKLDRHVVNQSWTNLDRLPPGKTPTEVFREHFMACFITDPSALRLRDRMGVETIAWECDYPHSDCTWPRSPEILHAELEGASCTDEEVDMITWKNVARFFRFDPFAHIPREEATVGALRRRAAEAGVDVAETSKQEYSRRYELAHASA
ncbi:MAG: amidohydrolase family protein [Acidimicrobiales bacterium]